MARYQYLLGQPHAPISSKVVMTAMAMVFASFLFVDDMDLIMILDSDAESSTVMMEHMQHTMARQFTGNGWCAST